MIKPSEAQGLKQMIERAMEQYRLQSGTAADDLPPSDLVLYLGNPYSAHPNILVTHPVLEPVDKTTWMVLKIQLQEQRSSIMRFDYMATARQVNVKSKNTLARAMAILRLMRWMLFYKIDKGRNDKGQFLGQHTAFLLFDEPLTLADTLTLDPGYLEFLQQSTDHSHRQVRRVASQILKSLRDEMETERDPLAPQETLPRIQARLAAHQYINQTTSIMPPLDDDENAFFCVSTTDLREIDTRREHQFHRSQNLTAVDGARSSSGSSIYIKKTTTTTPNPLLLHKADSEAERRGVPPTQEKPTDVLPANRPLVFPPELPGHEQGRKVAETLLAPVAPESRQMLIDELAGCIRQGARNGNPIKYPFKLLSALCRELAQGTFFPRLGMAIRAEREKRPVRTDNLTQTAPYPKPTKGAKGAVPQNWREEMEKAGMLKKKL
ncbi:MAG: hypothetical protein IDH49_08030 [Gammaproteobacteria bacterium]|nr:hypothetical protein [Gammaproteobacteria bacterium]